MFVTVVDILLSDRTLASEKSWGFFWGDFFCDSNGMPSRSPSVALKRRPSSQQDHLLPLFSVHLCPHWCCLHLDVPVQDHFQPSVR